MISVGEMYGEHPLPTLEDVVPNNAFLHPLLHIGEVIRPRGISTSELTEEQRVKRMKRSVFVSTCTTYNCFTNQNMCLHASSAFMRMVYVWGHSTILGIASFGKDNPPSLALTCNAMARYDLEQSVYILCELWNWRLF